MNVDLRFATPADKPALGKLAADLVRLHHSFHPHRFILGGDKLEDGYGNYLAREHDPKTFVYIADEKELGVVGYCFAEMRPRDWNMLLDEHGKIHDIAVDSRVRRQGIAKKLIQISIDRLRELGAQRILCDTAYANEASQKLFAGFGFQMTMIEMTL